VLRWRKEGVGGEKRNGGGKRDGNQPPLDQILLERSKDPKEKRKAGLQSRVGMWKMCEPSCEVKGGRSVNTIE